MYYERPSQANNPVGKLIQDIRTVLTQASLPHAQWDHQGNVTHNGFHAGMLDAKTIQVRYIYPYDVQTNKAEEHEIAVSQIMTLLEQHFTNRHVQRVIAPDGRFTVRISIA